MKRTTIANGLSIAAGWMAVLWFWGHPYSFYSPQAWFIFGGMTGITLVTIETAATEAFKSWRKTHVGFNEWMGSTKTR